MENDEPDKIFDNWVKGRSIGNSIEIDKARKDDNRYYLIVILTIVGLLIATISVLQTCKQQQSPKERTIRLKP